MADTVRSLADILALFADNTSGDISPQDLRDFVVSYNAIECQNRAVDHLVQFNGTAAYVDLLNALVDGFMGATGIDAPNSSGFISPTAGIVTPSLGSDVRLTGATPSIKGGGTATNINDNNDGTSVTVTPGSLSGQSGLTLLGAELDLTGSASNVSLTSIELRGHTQNSGGAVNGHKLAYRANGSSTPIEIGSGFTIATASPGNTSISVGSTVQARYVTWLISPTNYGAITISIAGLNAYGPGAANNTILRSISRSISDTPSKVNVYAFVKETAALTPGTDIILKASRDGNTSYVPSSQSGLTTLTGLTRKVGTLANGLSLFAATGINVSGQGNAKNLRWSFETFNNKAYELEAICVYNGD